MTVAVESIEKNDQYHLVTINGGMEKQYGLDLLLEDDTYRTMTFDDYPVSMRWEKRRCRWQRM